MENLAYTTYPFGYIGIAKENHIDGEGCRLIDEYYKTNETTRSVLDLNQLRIDVIQYALDQFKPFGGFRNFINYNLEHGKISKLARDFLEDTWCFIQTGKRRIAIVTWMSMLPCSTEDERIIHQLEFAHSNSDDSLGLWLSHDGGFLDMLWSLKLIFGSIE